MKSERVSIVDERRYLVSSWLFVGTIALYRLHQTRMEDSYESKVHGQILRALREQIFISVKVGAITMKSVPPDVLDKILQGDNAKIFYRAFTHESYDMSNSYEQFESMGDLVSNTLTGYKILEAYPHLDPEQLSNMLSHYKSNKVYGALILQAIPQLNTLILIKNKEIDTKIQADIFEALIHATYVTCNSVLPGIGYPCAENVYKILTRNFKPDIKYAEGNPKSVILEMFDKASVFEYPPKKSIFSSGDTITVTINSKGIEEVNRIMGEKKDRIGVSELVTRASGVDRNSASTEAYQQMIDLLRDKYKFDRKIFQEKKRVNTIRSYPGFQQVEAEEKRRGEVISFQKKKSDKKGMQDWRLIAQSGEKKRLVGAVTVSKDASGFNAAKMQLLQMYLNEPRT